MRGYPSKKILDSGQSQMHFVWVASISTSILPLLAGAYGNVAESCWIKEGYVSFILLFYSPVMINIIFSTCVTIYAYWVWKMIAPLRKQSHRTRSGRSGHIERIACTMIIFIISFVILEGIPFIYDFSYRGISNTSLKFAHQLCATLAGTVNFLIWNCFAFVDKSKRIVVPANKTNDLQTSLLPDVNIDDIYIDDNYILPPSQHIATSKFHFRRSSKMTNFYNELVNEAKSIQ